jgi:predicted ATPase/class 3 adenylate cyclase
VLTAGADDRAGADGYYPGTVKQAHPGEAMGHVEGTFTFLFTDIEGSTRLAQALGDGYPAVLAAHDAIVRGAGVEHGGRAFGSEGDAQALVFTDAESAIRAAVQAQRQLNAHAWPPDHPVRVRMGVHTGAARQEGDDLVGLALHATARIASAGHGGQVLVSAASRGLASSLPDDVRFRDLGEHHLKDFDEPVRLFQLDIDGLAAEFPPLRTRAVTAGRLPAQLTDFVGRAEVAAVREAIAAARIVTLTGPGGTGKTRLSIQVAMEVAPDFPDGAWFVALDSVRDPALVASEIAMTLGLMPGADTPIERLESYLRERRLLLVLDNLEQVIDAAADVARLVGGSPGLRVLATSRIPLDVYGEREFPVPALRVPEAGTDVDAAMLDDFEAARLFVARARGARSDFRVDDAAAPLVADIVRRLDGLPLAIELAAARLRTLPLGGLRDRLDDRLAILTSGARDRSARQQTLRGAIEWSHDLLDEPDQRLFARLGVLAGPTSLELIEQVCGPSTELGREVFEGLDSLVHQSLVRPVEVAGLPEPRFTMLATIREYAHERLVEVGEADRLERRHATAFLSLAETAAPHLLSRDGPTWNDRLEREHDDLRAALDWSVRQDEAEFGLRLITALWRFWQVRGHLVEGEARAREVLGLPSVASQSNDVVARAEGAAGGISYWRSDGPTTRRYYASALDHARAAGDRALLAQALYDYGFAVAGDEVKGLERYIAGEPFFEQARVIHRELGDRAGETSDLWALHQAAGSRGDIERSEQLGRETLELSRLLDDPFRTGWAAYTLATTILGPELQRLDEAIVLLEESLGLFADAGDRSGILLNVMTIAQSALRAGASEAGWRLIGAGRRANREIGADLVNESFALGISDARFTPETPDEQRSYDEGWRMSEAEAIELANVVARQLKAVGSSRSAKAPQAADTSD